MLADVIENSQNTPLKVHELDTAPEVAWQAVLEKTRVKWDLSTDIDMLLMVQKGFRCGIFDAI